jgi:hypothetical protein
MPLVPRPRAAEPASQRTERRAAPPEAPSDSVPGLLERLDAIEQALAHPVESGGAVPSPAPSVAPAPTEPVARTVMAYDVRPAAPPALAAVPMQAPEPPVETTVQVTIGRVDVHAHIARPSSATRARVPKLGLEDYLRRREGA